MTRRTAFLEGSDCRRIIDHDDEALMSQRLSPRLKSEEDRDSLERNDLSPTPQERGLKMRRTRCREPRRERERGGLEEDRSDPASTLSIRVEEERGGEIAREANGPSRKLGPEKSLPPLKVHDELRPLRDVRSCLLYTSPSPRARTRYRMPSSA